MMEVQAEDERRCRTPRQEWSKIPATACPPPPPRKKKGAVYMKQPPKNGYFQPPDLELFFALAFRKTHNKLDVGILLRMLSEKSRLKSVFADGAPSRFT